MVADHVGIWAALLLMRFQHREASLFLDKQRDAYTEALRWLSAITGLSCSFYTV